MGRVEVSDVVRSVARSHGGEAGERWLASLDDLVAVAVARWDLRLEDPIEGGTASWVSGVAMADGSAAVLKLAAPLGLHADLEHEVRVLELAAGRGCVRLLGHDLDLGVLLLERLGDQLHAQGLSSAQQIAAMCGALRELWSVSPDGAPFPTLVDKGPWLFAESAAMWEALDRPCAEAVLERSRVYVERRVEELDPARFVLAHGDAHPWNTLVDPAGGFRLIDPDGVLAEPEYDLAIIMRELTDELLVGDALALGRARACHLADLTGLDAERIWEWGYVERVATGLVCLQDGMESEGRAMLRVAEAWSRAEL